jgi:FKBP-type peptidyl-prolyl cis-trans isomerase 2
VFDSSEKCGMPLEFEVGSGQIIPGFEEAIMGMEDGEEKEFKLEPSDAYGNRNPQLVQKIPREQLPEQVEAGMMLLVGLPNGAQVPVKVEVVTDEWVTIDMNHPLAGQNLNFKIKVVGISS